MDPVVRVVCDEPGGSVVRYVRPALLTRENLARYWSKLREFPTLFNFQITSFEDFAASFVSQENGVIKPNGLVWEVDDVGLFFLTDIYPVFQASGHFTFWDRRFRGREKLAQEMLKYVFREFGFRRIIAEVPLYSQPTLKAVERIGFTKEGRLREYVYYQGEWWDVNLYSILAREILDDGKLLQAVDRKAPASVTGDATSD
jgi:RimJ/RimL family protein N-acetyltransferase